MLKAKLMLFTQFLACNFSMDIIIKDHAILQYLDKGTSLVEVLQNCVIFNDDIHAEITSKELREEHQLRLEHGKPMLFGKNKELGLIQEGARFKVVKIGENGIRKEDILVHDAVNPDDTRHYM